jgi:hypothetical protein
MPPIPLLRLVRVRKVRRLRGASAELGWPHSIFALSKKREKWAKKMHRAEPLQWASRNSEVA